MPSEPSHRDICVIATRWMLDQGWCSIATLETKFGTGVADAIGISKPNGINRITVIECKRTREDLLQDLRSKKYMKYEQGSSHCYFLATSTALKGKDHSVLDDMKARGLPRHWGVLVLHEGKLTLLRAAASHSQLSKAQISNSVHSIAKSLSYRFLKHEMTQCRTKLPPRSGRRKKKTKPGIRRPKKIRVLRI